MIICHTFRKPSAVIFKRTMLMATVKLASFPPSWPVFTPALKVCGLNPKIERLTTKKYPAGRLAWVICSLSWTQCMDVCERREGLARRHFWKVHCNGETIRWTWTRFPSQSRRIRRWFRRRSAKYAYISWSWKLWRTAYALYQVWQSDRSPWQESRCHWFLHV